MITVSEAITKFGVTRMMLKYWASQSVLSVVGKDGNRNLYNEVEIENAIIWSCNRRSDRAKHASHAKQKRVNPGYSGPTKKQPKAHIPKAKKVRVRAGREPQASTPRTVTIKFVSHDGMPGWARDMRELARSFRR